MTFEKSLESLLNITKGCRPDMHEPDEQGLTAIVTGLHLDNAFGNQRTLMRESPEAEEIIVTLRRTGEDGAAGWYNQIQINLATLIALARKAAFHPTYTAQDMKQARKEGFEEGFERGGGDWPELGKNSPPSLPEAPEPSTAIKGSGN